VLELQPCTMDAERSPSTARLATGCGVFSIDN
jgi:hypothetical protein